MSDDEIAQAWADELRVQWNGSHYRFDHDWKIPAILVGIDELLHRVANSRGNQFRQGLNSRGRPMVKFSKLAVDLAASAKMLDPTFVRGYLTRHAFSPYFAAWERRWEVLPNLHAYVSRPDSVGFLNEWLDGFRTELRETPFRAAVTKQRRAANKNAQGLREYVNALFRRYSRLLVVRVDFGYRNRDSLVPDGHEPLSDDAVKRHLKKLLRYARRKLPHLVGIVWKLEYGAVKGLHAHCCFLLDGHNVREGISWGNNLVEAWSRITEGKGTAWNCNAREDLFRAQGRRGVGLINYSDVVERTNLMRVLNYMAKSDFYARLVSPSIGRTFAKSKPIEEKSSSGRPRKHSEPDPSSPPAVEKGS